jgi:hypothetical protein
VVLDIEFGGDGHRGLENARDGAIYGLFYPATSLQMKARAGP